MTGGEASFTESNSQLYNNTQVSTVLSEVQYNNRVNECDTLTLDFPVPESPIQTSLAM